MKRFLTHGLPIGIGLILAVIILSNFGIGSAYGNSMNPTFKDGCLLLIDYNATPKDGDILVLNTEGLEGWENDATQIVKRYYADYSTDGYYVLGDNAEVSYDSRYCGEIPKDRLIGVVRCDLSNVGAVDFITAIATGLFN